MTVLTFVDRDTDRHADFEHGSAAWVAAMEWLRFHGLDPNRIACEPVYRDATNRRIEYTGFVFDADDQLVLSEDRTEAIYVDRIEQGEAPPLPLPAEVWL